MPQIFTLCVTMERDAENICLIKIWSGHGPTDSARLMLKHDFQNLIGQSNKWSEFRVGFPGDRSVRNLEKKRWQCMLR